LTSLLVVALAQSPPVLGEDPDPGSCAAARQELARASSRDPGDSVTKAKLVAALLLCDEVAEARRLAGELLRIDGLRPGTAGARGNGRLARVFELLSDVPGDVGRAIELLQELGARGDEGNIAIDFARALARVRTGESLRAAYMLEALAQRLREGVGVQVDHVRLVRRVESFGVYERDGRALFRPGEALLVYAEPAGFTCEPVTAAEDGSSRWRVALKVEVSLRDRVGERALAVWGPDEVVHTARAAVHDMHVTRLVRIPEDAGPGRFEVVVSVEDVPTGRSGKGMCAVSVGTR
jgi:hypothetical protein